MTQDLEAARLALQNKLAENAKEFVEALPAPVQARVAQLKALQAEHDNLEEQYRNERKALEEKFRSLHEPLYGKRSKIVSGTDDDQTSDPLGVPNFWLTALSNMPLIAQMIVPKDEEPLSYLQDIVSEQLPNGRGFFLRFKFKPNPCFTEIELTKTYYMMDEEDPILEKIEGSHISWQEGKDPTVKVMKKKPKKPGQKVVTRTEPTESFFNFFNPPQLPEDDEELDAEEADELSAEMENDYELGTILRDKIIPRAVLWYTGETMDMEEYEEYEDDDDDDDEDDDDEDEDDDDEDDAPKKTATSKSKKVAAAAGTAAGEHPPECKQQ